MKDHYYFLGFMIVSIVAYIFTFPQGWLIADESTYVYQALAILKGESYLTYLDPLYKKPTFYSNSRYTLGNAYWIALWTSIFGIKYSYIGSIFAIFGGIILLYKALEINKLFKAGIVLSIIYPASLIYSHTLMSGVPSFALSCLFVFVLTTKKESKWKWMFLTFIAAFSFWFRETNVLLLGGICLIHFMIRKEWFFYYAIGGMIGSLPRLISSWYIYDNPFHYVLGENFLFSSFIKNIGIYALLNMIFMPLGWFFFVLYKGKFKWEIRLSALAFFVLYLFYSYNALEYSGWFNGTFVMSRFMLPILPFYVYIVAFILKEFESTSLNYVIYGLGILIAIIFQGIIHRESQIHTGASEEFYRNYDFDVCLFDHTSSTNVNRYINPMRGLLEDEADLSKILDGEYMNELFDKYENIAVAYTVNHENSNKAIKSNQMNKYIQHAKDNYSITNSDTINIKDQLVLVRHRLSRK